MRLFNKVAIVGTGLIGGSLALAIKKRRLAREVIGVSRHKETLAWASKNGIIDRGSQDIQIIKDADLVILATPLNVMFNLACRISRIIRDDCIITDVGSAKEKVVLKLNKLFSRYVGSHPLAGSEKRGIHNIKAELFKRSLCVLTPLKDTNPIAIKKIKKLWEEVGCRVIFLKPETHDRILALVSHLPHAIAFALMNTIPDEYLKFSPASLKDLTRIAVSDSHLWQDIILNNKECVSGAIGLFQKNLSRLKSALLKKDKKALFDILAKAKNKRERVK